MRRSTPSTMDALAAGRLLARASGNRMGPIILILAGIVLLREGASIRARQRARRRHEDRPLLH